MKLRPLLRLSLAATFSLSSFLLLSLWLMSEVKVEAQTDCNGLPRTFTELGYSDLIGLTIHL